MTHVLLALFGIGAHHAGPTPSPAPSVLGHALSIFQGVPVGMWVAIIGFGGAVAGPIVAHVLETRRAKAKLP